MDQESDYRTVERLKLLIAQCDGSHSSVLSILSDLRNHVKSSDMLDSLQRQRQEMLEKVVIWAENSVNIEPGPNAHLIEIISLMKAREGKLKAVIKVCDPLFKDLPGYHESRRTMDQFVRELSQQVTSLYRQWCQSWSTVTLDTSKPCIIIDSKSQVPRVTFEPRLVLLSRECRTLRCLGFKLPDEIVDRESDLKRYGHIARQLEEIVHFYCNVGDQILLCQQPILINAARAFTSLLESRNNSKMTWDRDTGQLEAWIGELKDFAWKFAQENRSLRRIHRSLGKSIVKLFDMPMSKWRPLITETVSILASVDEKYDNTLTWKKHWDYQLYKILEYHFNWSIVNCNSWLGFHSNPYSLNNDSVEGPLRVDLTFRAGQVTFVPSLENIQVQLYSRINSFLATFTNFKGFLAILNPSLFDEAKSRSNSMTSSTSTLTSSNLRKNVNNIFAAIYLRNITNLPLLYTEAHLIMSELIDLGQQFVQWTSLYFVIQEAVQDPDSLSKKLGLKSLDDYRANLTTIKAKGQEFNKKFIESELSCSIGNITINLTPIKVTIDWIYNEADRLLVSLLKRETESLSRSLNERLTELLTRLTSPPDRISSLIELETFVIDGSMSTVNEIMTLYAEFDDRYSFLTKWSAKSLPNVAELVGKFERVQSLVDSRESLIASFKQLLRSRLESRSSETAKSIDSLLRHWNNLKSRGYPNSTIMSDLKVQFEAFGVDLDEYLAGCRYFGLTIPDNSEEFQSARREINDLNDRLILLRRFEEGLQPYLELEWIIARNKLALIEDYVDRWSIENADCGEIMSAKIAEWKSLLSTLRLCRGEAFAKPHWDQFISLLDLDSTIALESLKLSHLTESRDRLIAARDEIKELNNRAIGEQSVRETFDELEAFASSAKFDLTAYKMASEDQVMLIKNWRSILNSISESIVTLNSLKGSEYFSEAFAEAAGQWESRLSILNSMINSLNTIQRKWTYLEPIYSRNSGRTDLFNDSSFTQASRDFVNILRSIELDPHVIRILRLPGLSDRLTGIDTSLAACQRRLTLFMEESRNRFPRFYFLADDDLLLVLAGKTSMTESGLLKKLFNNTITRIHFEAGLSIAVESPEGERVRLRSPVPVNLSGGSIEIENWLRSVETEVRHSLKTDLFDCLSKEKMEDDLLWSAPSQIVSLVQWLRFTAETEECIRRSRLKSLKEDLARQLTGLISEGSKVTDPVIKIKVRSMILDTIHFISVIEELIASSVSDIDDWRWRKQFRYYADLDRQSVTVSMGLASVAYSFDYIGCYGAAKLVHTPLTDKCFLVCMQALSMGLGGNPYGPAGTGKTETVKALGHSLGRQVLVFNCDEAIDVKAMSRILIGLIKCGSWGCFDEFNRLQIEVLSSLSSTIGVIQAAFKSSQDKVNLGTNGTVITINRNSGIFVTLNPAGKQYKGRNELPDNLKALFLPVAMSVPDSALIARVLLLSEGFSLTSSEPLGHKITAWFELAKDSMSYQRHYDWGLRAIKSCLTSSGRLLRTLAEQQSDNSEIDISKNELNSIIIALQRQIKSKLIEDDQSRFDDLVVDVFGPESSKLCKTSTVTNLLTNDLVSVIKEMDLIVDDSQIGQIGVLDEQLRSRLGVVILGESGVGKSTTWKILMAYKRKTEAINIVPVIINPKAMSRTQLLGYIDEGTREWHDGVLTKVARLIARDESPDRFWIIFDGEIDPEWVEALNSVLDDNRVLTLPSGERIDFDPAKVSLLFETTSLQFSSPATISRVGLISLNFPAINLLIQANLSKLSLPSSIQVSDILDSVTSKNGLKVASLSIAQTAIQLLKTCSDKSISPNQVLATFDLSQAQRYIEPQIIDGSLVVTSSLLPAIELFKTLHETQSHILLIGERGTGKNTIVTQLALKSSATTIAIHCVPTTSPDLLISRIKENCHMITGTNKLLKPKNGLSLVIYIRNLELLSPDNWNCVTLVTFLTTLITYKGFHDTLTGDWMILQEFQVLATCNDLKYLDSRFVSLVNLVSVQLPPFNEIQTIIQMKAPIEPKWAEILSSGFVRLIQSKSDLFFSNRKNTLSILVKAMEVITLIATYETVDSDVLRRETFRVLSSSVSLEKLSDLRLACSSCFDSRDTSSSYSVCPNFGSKVIVQSTEQFTSFVEKAFSSWINHSEALLPRLAIIPEILDLASWISLFLGTALLSSSPTLTVSTLPASDISGTLLLGHSGSGRKLICKILANHFGYDLVWTPRHSTEKQVLNDLKSVLDSDETEDSGRKICLLIDQVHIDLLSFLQERLTTLLMSFSGRSIVRIVLCLNDLTPIDDQIWSRYCQIRRTVPWSDQSLKSIPGLLLNQNLIESEIIAESFVKLARLFPSPKADCRRYLSFVETFGLIKRRKFEKLSEQRDRLEKGIAKLEEASSEVKKLQEEATSQQAILATKRSEADAALNLITTSMHNSEDQKVELEEIKHRTERESIKLKSRKAEIEVELKEIEPILNSAKAAVGGIRSEALSEIRSLRAPPEAIRDILEGVLRLMGVSDTSWVSMKSFLSRRGVKDEIINFDARKITPDMRSKVEALLSTKPDSFDEKQARRASVAAAPLANWIKANLAYSKVLHKIKPLEDEQAKLEANLRAAQNRMKSLASELHGVELEVGTLRNKLNEVTLEAASIEINLNKTTEILSRSQELMTELGSEYSRWKDQLASIRRAFETLSSQCLVVAAYITFIGNQISSAARTKLTEQFCQLVGLDHFSISNFMEVSRDEDVFILTSSSQTTPFLIDPSRKSLATLNKAEIIDLTRPDWTRLLELALRFGKTVVLDGLTAVNITLLSVLRRSIYGAEGSRCYTYLGDKRVDFNANFQVFLFTAESSNPLLTWPWVSVINMSPSGDTTTENLLSLTVNVRRPELERKKSDLEASKATYQAKLSSLEDQLLMSLSSTSGNILNDYQLISSLKEIKKSAKQIESALSESSKLSNDINSEREQYRSLARLGSKLFHTIRELTGLNSIYVFGINEFETLFRRVLVENKNITEERLLLTVYEYIARALFPLDKAIFRRYLESALPNSRNLAEAESHVSLREFLNETLNSTDSQIILILTNPGTDPSEEIRETLLGPDENARPPSKPSFYSMGSDVINEVEELISSGIDSSLIVLSNLHVVSDWLLTLARLLTGSIQRNPKLFVVLITQANDRLPVSLLEICVKFVYLSSPGLRSLISSLKAPSSSFSGQSNESENSRLAYFHAVCCERRNYIPIGWTKSYDFGFNDYRTASSLIDQVRSKRDRRVQLQYIRGLLGSVLYGSKLDSQMDSNILAALVRRWFISTDRISSASANERNEFTLLGLAPNVNRWRLATFEESVEKGLKFLEKSATSSALAESENDLKVTSFNNEFVHLVNFANDLVQNRDQSQSKKVKTNSIEQFIVTEKLSIHRLASTISSDLSDRDSLGFRSSQHGETPETWLAQWPTGSVEVDRFVKGLKSLNEALISYLNDSNLCDFDLGHFLHPTSFLNAVRQKASRDLKISVDSVKTFCSWPGQRFNSPNGSVKITIRGLLLEGAIFDGTTLRDCNINSELQATLPDLTLHFISSISSMQYENEYVTLPVYGSKAREILVTWFDLPCKTDSQDDWITQGTAIIINHPNS